MTHHISVQKGMFEVVWYKCTTPKEYLHGMLWLEGMNKGMLLDNELFCQGIKGVAVYVSLEGDTLQL